MTNMIETISGADELRKMLNYIADRDRLAKIERQLSYYIAESFKRQKSLILGYITTTNEMYEFVELAGNDFSITKIRQLLHKTEAQCTQIIEQFGWMLKYIDSKLMQTNGIKLDSISDYENRLLDLQQSLNECEIHKKNKKSASLVRKIRVRINGLIEKIHNIEKKIPELVDDMNHISDEGDDDDSGEDENSFDSNDF